MVVIVDIILYRVRLYHCYDIMWRHKDRYAQGTWTTKLLIYWKMKVTEILHLKKMNHPPKTKEFKCTYGKNGYKLKEWSFKKPFWLNEKSSFIQWVSLKINGQTFSYYPGILVGVDRESCKEKNWWTKLWFSIGVIKKTPACITLAKRKIFESHDTIYFN